MKTHSLNPEPLFHALPSDWAAADACTPADFDGHTGFERMTPSERLQWLDAAVMFYVRNTKVYPPRFHQAPQQVSA
jgi:hypothetical protein